MKLMNERLDDLRRELARETQDRRAKEAIKGLRWLLLHRRDNLEKDAAKRLERSLEINQPLQCAYLLKEELGELWQQDDGRKAWAFLREWAAKATASGIRQLQAMAKTLLRHAKGILSFYHTGLTSGKMEGINRKIRGLLASAFGFRDDDFLKLRLYALHEAKFTFVGKPVLFGTSSRQHPHARMSREKGVHPRPRQPELELAAGQFIAYYHAYKVMQLRCSGSSSL